MVGRALVVLAAVLSCAGSADARDFCFNSTSPPNPAPATFPDVLVIGQKFKLPTRGKCNPIVGFDTGLSNGTAARPASGTACLNSAGTTLTVGILIHPALNFPSAAPEEVHMEMRLPYPALTNGTVYLHRKSSDAIYTLDQVRVDGVAGFCGFTFSIP